MKKKIVYAFLVLTFIQVAGYYTVAKKTLVGKLLSERERMAGLENVSFVNVNSNYEFGDNHKKLINNLFDNKSNSYYLYKDIYEVSENRIFAEDTLSYTFEIKSYDFPISIIQQSESIIGFGAHDEIMYAWIFFKWMEVKYIKGGIS